MACRRFDNQVTVSIQQTSDTSNVKYILGDKHLCIHLAWQVVFGWYVQDLSTTATSHNVRTEGAHYFFQTKVAAPSSLRSFSQARVAFDHASNPLLFTTLYKMCPVDLTADLNFQHSFPNLHLSARSALRRRYNDGLLRRNIPITAQELSKVPSSNLIITRVYVRDLPVCKGMTPI